LADDTPSNPITIIKIHIFRSILLFTPSQKNILIIAVENIN